MKPNTLTREEFEESIAQKLNKVVVEAREIRNKLRQLEDDITEKEEKIRNYQNTFTEIQTELVKVQAALYAGGTT